MKRLLAIAVACLLMGTASTRTFAASSNAEKELRFSNKVKAAVAKLGTGPESRVEIKLRDKTRLNGYVSEIGETEFVVTDLKTNASNSVSYTDVKQIKGNNLSTGARIGIGVGIGIAFLLLVAWMARGS